MPTQTEIMENIDNLKKEVGFDMYCVKSKIDYIFVQLGLFVLLTTVISFVLAAKLDSISVQIKKIQETSGATNNRPISDKIGVK